MLHRGFLALFAVLALYPAPRAFAAPNEDASIEGDRDEYDFSWLDPEKKIYVVQNRKFVKGNHFELSTSFGIGIGEAFRQQRQWITRGTFYLGEHWGISAFYFNNYNSANDNYAQVETLSKLIPSVRDTNTYLGGSLMWIPFYGKINLFNQIFYIDWDFELGLGQAGTQIDLNQSAYGSPNIASDSYTALHWGSGWKFIIDKHWGARLDFLWTHYSAPNGIVTGSTLGSDTNSASQTYNNYYLTLGIGYTF